MRLRGVSMLPGVAVAAAAGLATAVPLQGQDLEVAARERGIDLPAAYYARKAADPLAFELPNGLFGTRSSLPPVGRPELIPQRAAGPYEGVAMLPVVLSLFADSPEPWVTPQAVSGALFDGPAPRGTLTEFYLEASYGRFAVDGEVYPWTRSSLTLAEVVGTSAGLGEDARVGEYLMEALAALDDQVDFRRYDNDGPDGVPDSGDDDGVVDLVTFEFLEVAASCGGPGIWPHRWGISGWTGGIPWSSGDVGAAGVPVLVDGYIIQGATDCAGTQVQSSATMAHEFGHALGLPDYYHPVGGITPEFRRWVLGCWDLMAAGSWGCGPVGSNRAAFGPTHMSAWNRHILGWLDFVEVGTVRDTLVELGPIRVTGQALRVPLGSDPGGEALILELRDQGGFDRDVPAVGVLVTRLDPGGVLRPESGYRYFLSVLEADGDEALKKLWSEGGDRGAATDVFGVPGGGVRLNGLTNPSTRSGSGTATSVALHSIVVAADRASVRLSTDPQPHLVRPSAPLSARAGAETDTEILVAGGILPLQVTAAGTLAVGTWFETREERVRLGGVPLEEGTFVVELRVRDARGSLATDSVTVVVEPFRMEVDRLVDAVLGGPALEPGEAAFLDAHGNGNGNLDVGDVRAWRYPAGS